MRVLPLVFALSVCLSALSQSNNIFRYDPRLISSGSMPPVEVDESAQSKYLKGQWCKGAINLRNTNKWVDLSLQFDQYDNKLFFLEDGNMMELTEPISAFIMKLVIKNDSATLLFRNGYPSIHRNGRDTYYEVLVDGEYQLLRCMAKTIALYKNKDLPEDKRGVSRSMLYVFTPDDRILEVRKDRPEVLLNELGTQQRNVQQIITAHKLRLRSDKDLGILVKGLNGQ